jgi:hypothetical protein
LCSYRCRRWIARQEPRGSKHCNQYAASITFRIATDFGQYLHRQFSYAHYAAMRSEAHGLVLPGQKTFWEKRLQSVQFRCLYFRKAAVVRADRDTVSLADC